MSHTRSADGIAWSVLATPVLDLSCSGVPLSMWSSVSTLDHGDVGDVAEGLDRGIRW